MCHICMVMITILKYKYKVYCSRKSCSATLGIIHLILQA